MPHIHELLNTSISIIVLYREKKLNIDSSTATETTRHLLNKSHPEMIVDLTTYINEAIVAAEEDTRRPLMLYVLHIIHLLREFADQPTFLTDTDLTVLKQHLFLFVTDMKLLLSTSQITIQNTSYNETTAPFYGLKRIVRGLCDSGNIIQETLFSTLNLSVESTPEKIEQALTEVLNEHQRHLHLVAREMAVTAREAAVSIREAELQSGNARDLFTILRNTEAEDPPPQADSLISSLPRAQETVLMPTLIAPRVPDAFFHQPRSTRQTTTAHSTPSEISSSAPSRISFPSAELE